MVKEKGKRLTSVELGRMLEKGMKMTDSSLAFAKRAGRISEHIHPIQ